MGPYSHMVKPSSNPGRVERVVDWLKIRPYWSLFGILLCGMSAWVAYMIADVEPPYVYYGEESYIIPSSAEKGEQMVVHWKVKQNRYCPGYTVRQLFDPKTTAIIATYDTAQMAPVNSVSPEGYLIRTFTLPRAISSGRTGYRTVVCFSCNPLRRLVPVCEMSPYLYFNIE